MSLNARRSKHGAHYRATATGANGASDRLMTATDADTATAQRCAVFAPLRKMAGDYTAHCGQCGLLEHEHGAPEPRDIPAGKILLAEYGELNESNRARVAVLATKFSPIARADVRLIHYTAGFAEAGSAASWQNGGYRVNWQSSDGGIFGKRGLSEDFAREYFDALTDARQTCAQGHALHWSGLQTAYCHTCKAYVDADTGAPLAKQPF